MDWRSPSPRHTAVIYREQARHGHAVRVGRHSVVFADEVDADRCASFVALCLGSIVAREASRDRLAPDAGEGEV